IATALLAPRGYRIDGVELGGALAEFTRRKLTAYPKVTIFEGDFETFPLEDGIYDLAVSAQAFHWIDPQIGFPKLVRVLKPTGAIALWWNTHVQTDASGDFYPMLQAINRDEFPDVYDGKEELAKPEAAV